MICHAKVNVTFRALRDQAHFREADLQIDEETASSQSHSWPGHGAACRLISASLSDLALKDVRSRSPHLAGKFCLAVLICLPASDPIAEQADDGGRMAETQLQGQAGAGQR